jgi:RNA polymerase sigma factor (TIGR02999 family)
MADITGLLAAASEGQHAEQLLPLVYDELRRLAAARLASEKPGQTLQATALVHEAFLRLVDTKQLQQWESRGHFFAAAAEAMRRILVDNARHKLSQKCGGGRARVDLDRFAELSAHDDDSSQVLAIHEALTLLEAEQPRKAQLVKLRYFAGMTLEEAAAALDISLATAKRDWTSARVWLYREIGGGD